MEGESGMANIYLVRHCESEGNACRRTQAQTDALVTTKGYLQNEMLRRRFRDIPIDGIYSSDAFRSIMTVEPIAKERGLPIRVRIHLQGSHHWCLGGYGLGAILPRNIPKKAKIGDEHPWANTTPGASTFQQVGRPSAVRPAAHCPGSGGRNALCVSHSCTIKAGLCGYDGAAHV